LELVEGLSCALHVTAVALRPLSERGHGLEQRAAQRREDVLHSWRDGGVDRSPNEAVAFESAQREGQHPLRDAFNHSLEFIEALRALTEHGDHEHAPLVAHSIQYVANREAIFVVAHLHVPK
jgi:hypothetical protein